MTHKGHRVHIFKRGVKVDSSEGFGTEKEEPAAVPYRLLKTTRKSRQLNLSGPRVTEVPQSVWRLNLDTSEKAKQNLSFGADVRWWDQTDLTKLLLSSNMLEVLSEDIEVEAEHVKHLNTLSELELRDNKVKSVPEEITLVQGLECLDLINNDISSLPAALGLMLRLNILTLEGNPLRHIHGDLTARMTSLYLLSSMSKYIQSPVCFTNARIQMATEMSLTLLSQAKINVHAIKTLKTLDYTDKQAVCVPDDLFNAVDSEPIASVSKNQLAAMLPRYPAYISDFTPRSGPLEEKHKQCVVPEVLYQVPTLETILISNNQVGAIDRLQLKALDKLSTLDLPNNYIMQVPPELGNCTSLRALMLDGNPFHNPRAAIIARGNDAVLEYLRSRIPT
ncbi:leucine-rich repeat-containing protein 40-like [Salvelinus alpinus]